MPRSRSLSFAAPLALSLLAAPSVAQTLDLGLRGGALPGVSTFDLEGPPGTLYALLFALNEQSTPIPSFGITLDIPLTFVDISLAIPGFVSTLSPAGLASPAVPLPADPAFEPLVFSMQAVGQTSTVFVSNLLRMTPQLAGTWKAPLNAPAVPIQNGGVVAEDQGQLLFVGGSGPVAQRYASRLEEWSAAGASFGVGLLSQTTTLNDGRVLFTGGLDLTTGQPTAAAAIYDPTTQSTTTLAMGIARAGHGASLMGNGKVLVTGGFEVGDFTNPLALFAGIRASTEIFDPATDTFAPGPNMLEARAMHTSTTLTSGQVLVAGGVTLIPFVNLPTVSATAYRFNPANNSFGLPASFSGGRFLHSAAPLSNGKVLLVGGVNLDFTTFLTSGNLADITVSTRTDCQVYTPGILGFGTFATVAGMQEGRAGAAVASLPNGAALIAGGFQLALDIPNSQFAFNPTASADVYAASNTIAPTGAMAQPRLFPLAVNLPDDTVMVVGGGTGAPEIWQPN
ncbi:MAG: Kelch repeat-containing protein [Planctomycetota bacterium]